MNEIKIVKSYFKNDAENEFICVDHLTNGELKSTLIPIEEVLEHLFTIPQRQIPDSKILKKSEELVLKGKVEI